MKAFWQSIFWGILAGLVIGSASFLPRAHAEAVAVPSICAAFDAAPTFDTVNMVMQNIIDQGRNVKQAAEIVVDAVADHCPQNLPLLQAYVQAGQQQTGAHR